MRATPSSRVFGTIEELRPTCGFIRGDDGRLYFFIPSYVLSPLDFLDLQVRQQCCFLVLPHPRGLRATAITLVGDPDELGTSHAEAHS